MFEIVAEDQTTLVEVRVLPSDIDDVYPNQKARVVLSARNRHLVDPVDAVVSFTGADALTDQSTGRQCYTVRLVLNPQEQQSVPTIVLGMPVEAFLLKHDRTFADYIVEPFIQSYQRPIRPLDRNFFASRSRRYPRLESAQVTRRRRPQQAGPPIARASVGTMTVAATSWRG